MDSNKEDDFLSVYGSKDAVQHSESENVASGPSCRPDRKRRKGRSRRSEERTVSRGTRSTSPPSAANSSGENLAAEAVGRSKEDSKSLSLDTSQECGRKDCDTVSHDSECKSAARQDLPCEPSAIIHDRIEAMKAEDARNLSRQLPDARKIKQKRNVSNRKAKHLKEETFTSLKSRTTKRSLTIHSNKNDAEECEKANAEEESTSHLLTTPLEQKVNPPQEGKKVQMASLLSPASLKSSAGFQCTECSKAFKNEGALARHLGVHRTKQFACSDCEVVCKTGSLLWTHRQRAHIRKFECAECHKKYGMAYQLDRHIMRTHTGEKPHKCGECPKGFVSQQELRDHMECHNVDTPYLCHECGASFKRRDGLLHHVRRQHRPPRLSCELCGKSFKSPCSLRSHLEYHRNTDEGLAPYKCDICGNRYKTQKTLQGHLNRHKREANFQCHVCGKAFKFKHHLLRHEMVHLDKKPFNCPECKQGFTQQSNMLVHMRKHTGERPYVCDVCNKTFCQNISLKSHKQKKHGIDGVTDNVTSKGNGQHADSQTEQVNGHKENVMIDISHDTPKEISCLVNQRATILSHPIQKKDREVCCPEHLGGNHIVPGNQDQDREHHLLLATSPQQSSPNETRRPNNLNEQEDGEIQPLLSTRGEQTQEAFQDHQMEEGDNLRELQTQHDQPHGLQQQQEQELHGGQTMQSINNTETVQSKSQNTSGLDTVSRRPIGQGSITTSTLYSHYRLSSKLPGGQSSLSRPVTNATTALSPESPVGQSLSSQPQGSNPSLTLHHLSKVQQHFQAFLELKTAKSLGGALSLGAPSAAFRPFPEPPPSVTQQPIMSPAVVSQLPRMLAPPSTANPSFQPASPLNNHPLLKSAGKSEGHLPPSIVNQSLCPALCGQGVKPPSVVGIIPPHLLPSQSVGAYNGNASDIPLDSLIPFPALSPVPHQSAMEGTTPLQSCEEGARSLVDNLLADSNNRQAAIALASLHLPVGMGTQLQGATPYLVYPNAPNQYQHPMETGTRPNNNEFTE